jgi:hypothetical protein
VFEEMARPDGETYLLSKLPDLPLLTLRQASFALLYA